MPVPLLYTFNSEPPEVRAEVAVPVIEVTAAAALAIRPPLVKVSVLPAVTVIAVVAVRFSEFSVGFAPEFVAFAAIFALTAVFAWVRSVMVGENAAGRAVT